MRISANFSQPSVRYQANSLENVKQSSSLAPVGARNISNAPVISGMITFGGNKDKSSVIQFALEKPPYCKGGGVGTYMEDAAMFNQWIDDYGTRHPEAADRLKGAKTNHIVIPYYNGKVLKDGTVEPRMLNINGTLQPVYVAPDVSKDFATRWDELAKYPDKYTVLETVTSFDMDWGVEKVPVTLYKSKRVDRSNPGLHEYMVFCDKTARMRKPYDSSSGAACYSSAAYSSERSEAKPSKTGHLEFDEVMSNGKKMQDSSRIAALTSDSSDQMFCKAAIEAVERANINAETIVVSDAHAAYAPEYAAQRAVKQNSEYWRDAKFAVVEHNYGNGYLSIDSAKNLVMSVATPEQAKLIEQNSNYQAAKALGSDKVEAFFRQFCKGCLDDNGDVNPYIMSLKQTTDNGNVVRVFTVSDEAFQSILTNPEVSPLHGCTVETYRRNPDKVGGIINGLSNPKASPREELPFARYTGLYKVADEGKVYTTETSNGVTKYFALDRKDDKGLPAKGTELKLVEEIRNDKGEIVQKRLMPVLHGNHGETIEVKPFRAYFDHLTPEQFQARIKELREGASITDAELQAYKDVTNHNKISMLQRIIYKDKFGDSSWIAGIPGKKCTVMGGFDPKYLEMIQSGKQVPMVVDWSRVDKQKGFEQAIETIKTVMSKNPNLIALFGGEIDDSQPVPKLVKKQIEELTSGELKGRFAFVDGFAPGFSFASSAELALFTPTFAPCDLTDPEAMRKLAILIVNDTQGLKQKNFDMSNPADQAFFNAYKTKNEYNSITLKKIDEILNAFAKSDCVEEPTTLTEDLKAGFRQQYPHSCGDDFKIFRDFGKKFNDLFLEFQSEAADRLKAEQFGDLKKDTLELLKASDKYADFVNKLKVAILTSETSACLESALKDLNSDEVLKSFLRNMLIADPGWSGNIYANPKTGLSSADLYVKTLIMPDTHKVSSTVIDIERTLKEMEQYDLSAILGLDNRVGTDKDTTNTVTATFGQKVKQFAGKNNKALMIAGAVATAAAVIGGIMYSNNKKVKAAEAEAKAAKEAAEKAAAAQTPPPPAPVPQVVAVTPAIQPQAPAPMATTQAAVPNQASNINLSNNKFASCFNKIA